MIRVFQTAKPQMRKLKKKRSSWSITSGFPIRAQATEKTNGVSLFRRADFKILREVRCGLYESAMPINGRPIIRSAMRPLDRCA